MKKLLTIIIASAILYLLFAFVTLSFNPFNWQEITRAFYVSLLIIIDFAILTSPKDLFKSSVDWLAEQMHELVKSIVKKEIGLTQFVQKREVHLQTARYMKVGRSTSIELS